MKFEALFRDWCVASGARWHTFEYSRPSGTTQAHRMVPRGAARGAVLLAHGAGNDALFSLTGICRDLLERRIEVFTFDLDGHGRNSTTRLRREDVASIVPAALEAWRERPSDLPLHAVGVSFGASLLLHSLPRLPVRSAVLMAAPLQVRISWAALAREASGPVVRTAWRERRRFGMTGLIPSFGPFRRRVYPLRLGEAPGPGAFGYVPVLNRILDQLELPDAASRTSTPILLVHGGRDLLVPAEQAQRLHRLMSASELLLQPRETHLSTPLAPAVGERLRAWIDRHCDGP